MKKLLLFIFLVLNFSTCKKDDPKPAQPDVYICGMTGVNGLYFVAKYWKNGVETVVDDKTVPNSYVYSLTVSGTDVYLAGHQLKGTNVIATYWKNKEATALTAGIYAVANSIAVEGSDIYVAGMEFEGTVSVAKVWKNGVAVRLTDGTRDANATSIAVIGGDVYVAGYEGNLATYWKNGIPTKLANVYQSAAVSIAVLGTDVYTLGYEYSSTGKNLKYWKNGIPTQLTNSSPSASPIPGQIAVDNTGVYACGTISDQAYYWKDGVAVPLTDGTHVAAANGITVYNGDVYVVGWEFNANGRKVGKLWKNAIASDFAGNTLSNEPWAVIVK